MEILIDNRQTRIALDPHDIRTKTERVLEDLGYRDEAILSIALVDALEMARLNMQYRGKEGPTNVLSFAQREDAHRGSHPDLLGDVVICTDRAADDARELGYTDDEMVLYLLIHGILHLVGYDHTMPAQAETMEARVEQIFGEITSEPMMIPS